VGPPWFDQYTVPLALMLVLLSGIGPVIAWRRATAANLRRNLGRPALAGVLVAGALLALGAVGLLARRLAGVSSSTGAPAAGLAFVMGLDLVLLVVFAAAGSEAMDVFFYLATIGVLSLLAMYLMTNVAALRFLRRRAPWAELLLPTAGIAVAGYVLYHNIWPVPEHPFDLFPYLVGGWLLVGVALSARARAVP
jgi:amino acid transporter